ncbi:MAG: ribonuclease P protein component [Spirosomataceae bacterium]
MRQTFRKTERLNSKKIIDRLFKKGSEETKAFFSYPFRILYLFDETLPSTLPSVLFSVSKRTFKHAVDRNLIKRRLREAYRRHKSVLVGDGSHPLPAYIAFVYVAKDKVSFVDIEKKMKLALKQLR